MMGAGVVAGSLYRLGEYPGWKPRPAGEVRGELYRLRNAEETLGALDEYEGDDFERIAITTAGDPGETVWIYLYKGEPAEETRILSGDFCV